MLIYKITNLVNGKIYIGQTNLTLKKRLENHWRKALYGNDGSYIHNSMKKYGKSNFTIEQMDAANNQEELNHKEHFWAKKEDSYYPNGMNLKLCGNGGKHAASTILKLSKTYSLYDKENNLVEITNLADFSRKNKLQQSSMYAVFNGLKESYNGWTKEKKSFIYIFDLKDEVLHGFLKVRNVKEEIKEALSLGDFKVGYFLSGIHTVAKKRYIVVDEFCEPTFFEISHHAGYLPKYIRDKMNLEMIPHSSEKMELSNRRKSYRQSRYLPNINRNILK